MSATAEGQAAQSRRGRPSDPEKRRALVNAARELFLRFGVEVVTVDQVIAAAGVSRSTYYSHFGGRDALVAAVFRQESQRIVSDEAATAYRSTDLRSALVGYGDTMMRFLADPDSIRFERLIQHARETQPALAAQMFAAGPGRAWDLLADIVSAARDRGELELPSVAQAIDDLVGLWQGAWRTAVMYGERAPPDEQEQMKRSRHAMDVFLRAHRPRNI